MKLPKLIALGLAAMMTSPVDAQVTLVVGGKPTSHIVIAANATPGEKTAAGILQDYLMRISGARVPVIADSAPVSGTEVCIGSTNRFRAGQVLGPQEFSLKSSGPRLQISAGTDRSLHWAVYHLLDRYLGCRKFSTAPAIVPRQTDIRLPATDDRQQPAFTFRQVYFPGQYDAEFRDWHRLQLFEDSWGLWGHSFDKLVPAKTYFREHPEYYALVNGERTPAQLCLSHPAVLRITLKNLGARMAAEPDKTTWSVSQNDGFGFCTCSSCRAADRAHGGPQGSLIRFVNKVAARFPGKTIATLAYLYTRHPVVNLKLKPNMLIVYSTIDADRALPIGLAPTAASYRADLAGWARLTNNLVVWDYTVQFTNYLAPFPNLTTLGPNLQYYKDAGVKGIFSQGPENSLGEFSELKAYLLARLSWNPSLDVAAAKNDFFANWFGDAAAPISRYVAELETLLLNSRRRLDIYGDPIAERTTWLSPNAIDALSDHLDEADKLARGEAARHVAKERLALEFTVLQQARFYGLDRYGLFTASGDTWSVRRGFRERVDRFIAACRKAGVNLLNEEGLTLAAYASEWQAILALGPVLHTAMNKYAEVRTPFENDFPAKGARTLIDGSPGYDNLQYNYLGWLGKDMDVIIDLGDEQPVASVTAGFLEDQRHWSFLPAQLSVALSTNGKDFFPAGTRQLSVPEEIYERHTARPVLELPAGSRARYVRVIAKVIPVLPEWRNFPNRRPWIFCDEIAVR